MVVIVPDDTVAFQRHSSHSCSAVPRPGTAAGGGAAGSQSPPTVSCNCAEPIAPVHRAWVLSEPLLDIGIVPQ
jgi:hypothetical protein